MSTKITNRKTMEQIQKEKMYAVYNGQTYQLLYIGATKFGYRAHLLRTNGDKFWVDPYEIVIVNSNGNGSGGDSTHVTSDDINLMLSCLFREEQSLRKALGVVTVRSDKREAARNRIKAIKLLRSKLVVLNEE
jgi:hypothetical protein